MLNAIVYKIVDLGPSKGGKKEPKQRHISVPDSEIAFKIPLLRARGNGNRKATMNFKQM